MAAQGLVRPAPARSRPLRRGRGAGWVTATYVALVVFLVWTLVPFVWMLLTSVKTNKEIYRDFTFLPKEVYWDHYEKLLTGRMGVWLRNSAFVSSVTTAVSLVLGSIGAYAVTRLHFAGRRAVAQALVLTYLVPSSLLFIPLFQTVAGVGLSNTLGALLLVYPTFTLPYCTWMLMSYFKSIPAELEEAALIDGCDRLGVLWRVTLPLSLPAISVVALFSFTQSWNEFLYALVFTNSQASRTVTVGLTQMLGDDVFFWGQMMAGAVMAALPSVVMYTAAQRLVIQGLTVGGIKG